MAHPVRPPYGPSLNFDQARRASMAAEAEAKKHGWRVAVAVTDTAGELVHFSRLDDTQYGSIEMAIKKAACAARFRRSTEAFAEQFRNGDVGNLTLPGCVAYAGGEPILAEGRVIGAIGVSGATADEDGIAAKAGAAAVSS